MALHLVCVRNDGAAFHTIRDSRGSWVPFGILIPKPSPGASPPGVTDVACAGVGNDLQVCLITQDGGVIHAIRDVSSGNWTPWGDLLAAGHVPGGTIWSIAATGKGNQLHVGLAVQTRGGIVSTVKTLLRAIRNPSGSWKVEQLGGSWDTVACSSTSGRLHFCGTTFDHSGVHQDELQHEMETTSGSGQFTGFADVRSVVLGQNPLTTNPGSVDPKPSQRVACAGDGDALHVCTISKGRLLHTTRRPDGSWTPFMPVGIAGLPSQGKVSALSCVVVSGVLHVVVVSEATSGVFHTMLNSGGFIPFGNVTQVVGIPGPVVRVGVAEAV